MSLVKEVGDILDKNKRCQYLAVQRSFQHISGHICLAESQTVFWDLLPEYILFLQYQITRMLLAKTHTVVHLARPDCFKNRE